MLSNARENLFKGLRVNALALVEAQGHSDSGLRTAIGTEDGAYAERLYNCAKEFNEIN